MNMILFQNMPCEAMTGLVNAGNSNGYSSVIWNNGQNLKDIQFDILCVFNPGLLGYDCVKCLKNKKVVFVNCKAPSFIEGAKAINVKHINTEQAIDKILYPDVPANELFSRKTLVYLDQEVEEDIEIAVNSKDFFIVGPVENDSKRYIGNIKGKDLVSAAKACEKVMTINPVIGKTLSKYVDCYNFDGSKIDKFETTTFKDLLSTIL